MALLPNINFLIYKKLYDFFYEWGSTVSKLQSQYEDTFTFNQF